MSLWPSVTIRVSSEFVNFTSGLRSSSLAPRLYLDSDSPSATILGVGEPPATVPSIRVDLFLEQQRPLDYSSLLAAFLRHGFSQVHNGSFFSARPRLRFRVDVDVRAFLRHYHRGVFAKAGIEAGAISEHITFDEDEAG